MRFPARPPELKLTSPEDFLTIIGHLSPTLPDGRYLHWDDLRRRPPPEGLTSEQWWYAHKLARNGARLRVSGFEDAHGREFSFCRLDALDRATHQLDRRDAVREMLETIGDASVRAQYRIDQLMEEAISSSLVEGAQITTRALAKAMIADGRAPRAKGERMIFNNYLAMQRLLELANRDLTLEDLLEIHSILGADALEVDGGEGRLRTEADNVRVVDVVSGDVWFTPPPAGQLERRLAAMIAFANSESDKPFVHPLLRAIILHFWLAYLHPFVDGNGRMARALFYWQMLRAKYDFAQYLSISGPIEHSKRSYYRAFVLSETDEGDLTYFLLHQLSVLQRATTTLIEHVTARAARMRDLSRVMTEASGLNERQQSALAHLLRTTGVSITVMGHANSHGVSYLTARKDLLAMTEAGLLERKRVGKTDRFAVTSDALGRFTAGSER